MKLRHGLMIAGISIAMGVGAFAGIATSRNDVEVKAAEDVYTVLLDLRGTSYFEADGAKFALCYQDDGAGEYWTSFAVATSTDHVYSISLPDSVGFTPTKAFVSRQNGAAENPGWGTNWNNFGIGTSLQTEYVSVSGSDDKHTSTSTSEKVYIKGGVGTWSETTINVSLNNIKVNEQGHFEFYGEVTFTEASQFKANHGGTWSGAYSRHNSLSEIITGDGENNISCSTAGTYEMYYDYTNNSTYVTTKVLADADEWADGFNHVADFCDVDDTDWAAFASSFAKLSAGAQALFNEAASNQSGSILEKAAYRYDNAVTNHGKTPFAGGSRASAGAFRVDYVSNTQNNSAVIIASVACAALVLGGVGIVAARKRKEDR